MQVWQFRVAVTSTELLTSSGQSVSASVSRSALWACPRPKFAQPASVPKASFSFPSMYTRESFTRSHVEVSASLDCGFQYVRAASSRSFHTDVCEDNIACTIFVAGALAATIVGMMFVEWFYMVRILAVCKALALGLQQGGPVVCGKQQRHIIRPWSQQ